MSPEELSQRMQIAEAAARRAGAFLREQFEQDVHLVDERLAHDIKLRLDKETQAMIADDLLSAYPQDSFLGEEGNCGAADCQAQWIVDPIDGTVNFFYGIPIFCVAIALRVEGELVLGCVYDPMQGECYQAIVGGAATCNGKVIHASPRRDMSRAVVFVGHGRHDQSGQKGMERFARISAQVCKMRILGSAALSLCYIAHGRMDAYVEHTLSLWDFAAAQVILEAAGGRVDYRPRSADEVKGQIIAWNGLLPIHDALQGASSNCDDA
ncbi:MAG: inositol monophosphatase family protein [Akkermansia sp.]